VLVAGAGFVLTGRRVGCTRYRPDRWHAAEFVAASSGLAAGMLMWLCTRVDPLTLNPSLASLSWPTVSLLPVTAVLVGALPALLTPHPPLEGLEPVAVPDPAAVRVPVGRATA
jgi:energy-coupling factor transport system permease protein